MNIDRHISELLFQHDCVIVPDLGGFVANYAPAKIHPVQHTFHPPSKNIIFNKNLKNNDGLLTHQISHAEGKTYAEASVTISNYVNTCKDELTKGLSIEIKNVGVLFFDVERNIQFEPDKTVNYLLDSFGLAAFQSPAIKRENYQEKIEKQFKDRIAIPAERKKIRIKKYVALALVIPFLTSLVWISLGTGLLKNVNYSNFNLFAEKTQAQYKIRTSNTTLLTEAFKESDDVLSATDTSNTMKLSLINEHTGAIIVKLKEDTLPIEKLSPDKTAVKASTSKNTNGLFYHVVGGCFEILDNARRLVKQLQDQNINAAIIGQNNSGLYIVSCGGFEKHSEALEELEQIRSDYPAAWLLKR